MMRATSFEFRNRFWMMGVIFWLGFFCYSFDHVNAGVALLGSPIPATSTPISFSIAGVDFIFAPMTYEMFGLTPGSREGRLQLQVMFGIAALLVAASAMMRTWATAYLQRDVVQDSNFRTEALVADGPYRHVRNPLYFANVLMALSMALLASRTGWLVIVAGMIVFQYRLIGREELELSRSLGERYRAYCRAVPRLWPSIRPRVPAGELKPRWKQAWLAEAFFFWGFAAAMASFAVTLNPGYAFGIFALSIIWYLLVWKFRWSGGKP
jgi:protein-S-isoprenylcysteine O-methyltransferase Ste14